MSMFRVTYINQYQFLFFFTLVFILLLLSFSFMYSYISIVLLCNKTVFEWRCIVVYDHGKFWDGAFPGYYNFSVSVTICYRELSTYRFIHWNTTSETKRLVMESKTLITEVSAKSKPHYDSDLIVKLYNRWQRLHFFKSS